MSNEDKARRERDKELLRRALEQKQRRRDEAVQRSLDEAAEAEKRAGKWSDDLFNDEIQDIFGASLGEIRKSYDSSKDNKQEVKKILDRASKLSRGGNKRKAAKLMKQNKSKIRKAAPKKGCSFFALILLAAFSAAGYGVFDVVHSVIA